MKLSLLHQPAALILPADGRGAHRRDFHPLELLVGQVVDHAHEADARDANSHHFCESLLSTACVWVQRVVLERIGPRLAWPNGLEKSTNFVRR